MRKTVVTLLALLLAAALAAGSACARADGDSWSAATSAGVQLGTAPRQGNVAFPPLASSMRLLATLLSILVMLASAASVVAVARHPDRDRTVLRRESRVARGPPAQRID